MNPISNETQSEQPQAQNVEAAFANDFDQAKKNASLVYPSDYFYAGVQAALANPLSSVQTEQPQAQDERDEVHNPWRESLENCINGDNYLRASEYRSLIEELDDLYRLRSSLSAPQDAIVTPDHDGSTCGQCGTSGVHMCRAGATQDAQERDVLDECLSSHGPEGCNRVRCQLGKTCVAEQRSKSMTDEDICLAVTAITKPPLSRKYPTLCDMVPSDEVYDFAVDLVRYLTTAQPSDSQPSSKRLVSIIAAMNGWDMPGGLPKDVKDATAQPADKEGKAEQQAEDK